MILRTKSLDKNHLQIFHKTVESKATDPISEVTNLTGTSSNTGSFITRTNKNADLSGSWRFVVQNG